MGLLDHRTGLDQIRQSLSPAVSQQSSMLGNEGRAPVKS